MNDGNTPRGRALDRKAMRKMNDEAMKEYLALNIEGLTPAQAREKLREISAKILQRYE